MLKIVLLGVEPQGNTPSGEGGLSTRGTALESRTWDRANGSECVHSITYFLCLQETLSSPVPAVGGQGQDSGDINCSRRQLLGTL